VIVVQRRELCDNRSTDKAGMTMSKWWWGNHFETKVFTRQHPAVSIQQSAAKEPRWCAQDPSTG
jgi:hypothetical protein